MAKVGQTAFKDTVIDVVSTPVYLRNFVRIMSMMAAPPDGKLYDVFPKNGIKPMYFNKYDDSESCVGFLDIDKSFVDDDNELINFVITNRNTLSGIEEGDTLGIYAGGTPMLGMYAVKTVEDERTEVVEVIMGSVNHDIFFMLKSMSPLRQNIPVWAARVYSPPPLTTEVESTTTGTTTGPALNQAIVMDYYVDWSGGMDLAVIGSEEYSSFTSEETVSVKFDQTDQACQWKKLCNATGISINMDTANQILNATLTTGIITSGKTSIKEPQYWLLYMGDDVYLRVYLNIHEINYKMLGKYYLNYGQMHNNLYFRDGSVYGDLAVDIPMTTFPGQETYEATFTITTPAGSPLWADFWDELLPMMDDPDIAFDAEIHIMEHDTPYWYPCILKHNGTNWTADFEVDMDSGYVTDPYLWADIVVRGMFISKTVDVLNFTDYSVVYFTVGEDALLNQQDIYNITYNDEPYILWWEKSYQEWRIIKNLTIQEGTTTEGTTTEYTTTPLPASITIVITSRLMSYDSVDFSTETGSDNLFQIDNTVCPEYPYYFRMKCVWNDIICYLGGTEAWIRDANIFYSEDGDKLPSRYGIYALSYYYVDAYGNQTRIVDYDEEGDSRYVGIYGRNYMCKLSDTYPDGLTLYPPASEFCVYYPPCFDKVLLTRANRSIQNYIEYAVSANTINFDLSPQLLGDERETVHYASYDLQLDPGGSTLTFQYKYPGIAGNGFTVELIKTVKAAAITILGPIDNVLKIFFPPEGAPDTYLLDIYNALNPRMLVDYGITTTFDGDEYIPEDLLTEDIICVLSGGGDEMIVTNLPSNRDALDVYMHPGFMLNGSRRQSPINMVGIYAAYLSANYQYADGAIDVVAIEDEQGIDLYAAIFSGTPRMQYQLDSDISPKATTYTDAALIPANATATLTTTEDDLIIDAMETGWTGNGISFSFVWLDKEEWSDHGYDIGTYFVYEENVPDKAIVLYVQIDDGTELPVSVIKSDDLIALAVDSKLVTFSYTGANGEIDVEEATYYLSGGGGVGTTMFIHYNGYLIGLEATANPGEYDIVRGYADEERWLFEDDYVDLLAYRLENVYLGDIDKDSQHPVPFDNMWDIPNKGDYAAICAMIDDRKNLEMINYINVGGREIALTDITYADGTYTITTDEEGNNVINKLILHNGSAACNINDIYYHPQTQSDSISKSMIYYGKYQPRITVQIPNIEEWGASLVPYYIVRLIYKTVII